MKTAPAGPLVLLLAFLCRVSAWEHQYALLQADGTNKDDSFQGIVRKSRGNALIRSATVVVASTGDLELTQSTKTRNDIQSAPSALTSEPPLGKMLVTTAYWKMHSKRGDPKKSDGVYHECMRGVMSLNSPMHIYGDADALQEMRQARKNSMPSLVGQSELMLKQLGPCSAHWQELHANVGKYTNKGDVPSIELGCLWVGKVDLLARSAKAHPEYIWHAWMDACIGGRPFRHDDAAWPRPEMYLKLPRDKITVSYSGANECEQCRSGWGYCHCLAGTDFVVPGTMVEQLATNFSKKVNECLDTVATGDGHGAYVCLSDQVILTKLYLEAPDVFSISSSGYGAVVTKVLSGSSKAL